MNPPKMVAADTPDRGRMWYLVDDNLDFISEVKLFLDWKAATQHAPATIKAYCSRLLCLKQHLPTWENKAKNLLITVEALRDNPVYARAKLRHEQELAHAEKVIATIKREAAC